MPLYRQDANSASIDTIDELCELQYETEQQLQKQKAQAEALQRKRSNSGFGKRLTRLLSFERSPSTEKKIQKNLEEEKPKAARILINSLRKFTHSRSSEVSNDDDRKSMSDLRDIDGRPVAPNECPLFDMTARGNGEHGFETFLAIKRKPQDYQVPSTSVVPTSVTLPMSPLSSIPPQIVNLPVLIVMNNEGFLSTHQITLHEGLTEVGSDSQMSNFSPHNIYLDGDDIRGRHAAITFMEGVVTLTPSTRDAYLEVNGQPLMQTEILRDGDTIRIGADHLFKFSTNPQNSNQRHFQQQTYPEMVDSRASTARCAPSDYCSLPLNGNQNGGHNDYYPPRCVVTIRSLVYKRRPHLGSLQPHLHHHIPHISHLDLHQLLDYSIIEEPPQLTRSQFPLHLFLDHVVSHFHSRLTRNLPFQYRSLVLIRHKNLTSVLVNSKIYILPPYSTSSGFSSKMAQEPIQIPLSIQIGDYNVWDFLAEVMSNRAASSSEMSSFRLSPAYSLYLALRFFHAHNKPYSVQFFSRIESNFKQIAQECNSKDDLIFWLANASEFNHLVERDTELKASRYGKVSIEIERIFRRLVHVLRGVIRPAARALLDIHLNDHDATGEIVRLLDSTMRQARICGLNAALTIQLCGHLLHMVNAFVFNTLVSVEKPGAHLTTRLGKCLQYRVESIHRFCERMGVELAAECHLDRTRQAANLLAAQKNDVATLGSTCYKLNSLQVVHLLSGFQPENGEIPCDDDIIHRICHLAEKQADVLTLEDGQRNTLEENEDLSLPFLIPQDGYFIEQFKTVPEGLHQYLLQLQHRRLCHSVSLSPSQSNPHPSMTTSMHAMHIGAGDSAQNHHQTHYQHHQQTQQPIVRSVSQTTLTSIPTTQFGDSFGSAASATISKVTLRKNGGGIGLSIVAAQGVGESQMGIYVKKVVEGTPASQDGRLETGDQLLSVNGRSLIGISQEDAARLMTQSGNEVHFEVRKGAAHRNGLSNWLGPQTPTTSTINGHFVAPSPSTVPPSQYPPSYSNVSRNGSYDSAPPPGYNQRFNQPNGQASGRNSAFVAPLSNSSSNASSSHLQQHYAHHNMHHGMMTAQNGDPNANKHYRSSSTSDLQQDPNASFSQSSMTGSARSSLFDKLPSHYRHSTRPTVIQPTRPGAQSPSALRKGAPSPVNVSTSSNLYRPTSASNLFAPPRNSGGLVGYSSNAARESTQDIHRALNDLELNSPLARSTPNHDESYNNNNSSYRIPPTVSSSSNYAPLHSIRPASMYGYNSPSSSSTATGTTVIPTALGVSSRNNTSSNFSPSSSSSNTSPRVNVTLGGAVNSSSRSHNNNNMFGSNSSQEPAIVRPVDLNMPKAVPASIKGAVPTAITQALQLKQNGGGPVLRQIRPTSGLRERLQDADIRNLEKTNTALMSYEAVNEELDRLDTKGTTMTDEEQQRYRELLQAVAEQSRARKLLSERTSHQEIRDIPIQVQKEQYRSESRRTETMIDDVPHSSSSVENVSPVSPPESRKVQFIDEVVQYQTPTTNHTATFFTDDVPVLDSPGVSGSIVGTNEIYRDPRQRRLNELQDRNKNSGNGADGAKLDFRDKQRLFARQIGEESVPRQRMDVSSAQRLIETDLVAATSPATHQKP
ncbi:hypothetical protein CAEBREN_29154 [Caenorhabditis brenneri]|uniref:Uncharacterized protein n=1 Tax=Caenorhabditis brenneri TaxID=135651 RepID=G0MNJ2_CAEBE|nr:hypothetical protein CAEBREN_29154 [Caenorhabditis brenneri]